MWRYSDDYGIYDSLHEKIFNDSFERSEDQWKEICDDFYQKWMIEGDEWPYIAEKEEVRVVLDYDKPNKEASLFLKRIE